MSFEEFVEENLCIVLFRAYARVSYHDMKLKFKEFETNNNYIDYIDTYICDICNKTNNINVFDNLDDIIEHLKQHYNDKKEDDKNKR